MYKARRKAITAWLLPLSVLLYGCDYVAKKGKALVQSGTVAAVEQCIATSASEMVNEHVTRRLCIRKNEQPFNAEYNCHNRYGVQQRTAAEFECYASFAQEYGKLVFDGSVDNDSSDLILTRYSVEILSDNEQFAKDATEYRDKWIQPGEYGSFSFTFNVRGVTLADLERLNAMDWRVRLHAIHVVHVEVD